MTKQELIDRNELIRIIKNASMFNSDCPAWVFNVINNMPAIELRPADIEMEYWKEKL